VPAWDGCISTMSVYLSVFVALLISLSCHSRLLKKSTASLDAQPLDVQPLDATLLKEHLSIGLEFEGLTLLFGRMELAKAGASPRQTNKLTEVPAPLNGVGFVDTGGHATGGKGNLDLLTLTRDMSMQTIDYDGVKAYTGEFVTGPIPFGSDLDSSWTYDGVSMVNTLAIMREFITKVRKHCHSGPSFEISSPGSSLGTVKVISIQDVLQDVLKAKTPPTPGPTSGTGHTLRLKIPSDTAWIGCGVNTFGIEMLPNRMHCTFGTSIEGLIGRIIDGKMPAMEKDMNGGWYEYAEVVVEMKKRGALTSDSDEEKGALDTLLLFVAVQAHMAAYVQSRGIDHTGWKQLFRSKPRIGRKCVELYNLCSPEGKVFFKQQTSSRTTSFSSVATHGKPPIKWDSNGVTHDVHKSFLRIFGEVCAGSKVPDAKALATLHIETTPHPKHFATYPGKFSKPYFLTEAGEIGLARDMSGQATMLFEHRSDDGIAKRSFSNAVNADNPNNAEKVLLEDATKASMKVYACAAGMLKYCTAPKKHELVSGAGKQKASLLAQLQKRRERRMLHKRA